MPLREIDHECRQIGDEHNLEKARAEFGERHVVWRGSNSVDGADEVAAAEYPMIRLCRVTRVSSQQPTRDIAATRWPCNPDIADGFTAVGCFFGPRRRPCFERFLRLS